MHYLAERRSKIGQTQQRPPVPPSFVLFPLRRALQTCGKLFQRATPRAFVWFAARPESSEETRASLSPRFPPGVTEPSDESYVAPSVARHLWGAQASSAKSSLSAAARGAPIEALRDSHQCATVTEENDELLKNELDRRSALLDEAVAVVRGSIPDIDAYTAAEVQINNSKVLAKQDCGLVKPSAYFYEGLAVPELIAILAHNRVRAQIHIAPLQKNMSPVYHRARRDARARKLAKQYGTDPDTLYTDAASCGTHGFSLAAVGSVSRPGLITCASAGINSVNTAETLAVALAIKTKESLRQGCYTLTDSQIACRYFTSICVPECVAHLLGATLDQDHSIIWCPAVIEATRKDRAAGAARALTHRATVPRLDTRLQPQAPHTPRDILEHQRRQRRRYSTPHPRLNVKEAHEWRLLQTNTYTRTCV
ncbi:hypothetical protein HPB50_015474 [Hyalomma asiaticum]|uniref:Uncharacterized protein n=1 Tax=Hyalomma asiaticum TaxID=266040 RepID=A0ACB7S0Y6_HYAAI|nr:hypothetical protein HPB50_015474 [Hyalomma asiaticum]